MEKKVVGFISFLIMVFAWTAIASAGTGSAESNIITVDTRDISGSGSAESNIIAVDTRDFILTVVKSGTGSGNATSNPTGIDCGDGCAAPYLSGTSITLTATPDSGSIFTGWSGGGCSATAPCTVNMDTDKTVSAIFADTAAPLITVSQRGGRYIAKQTITLSANEPSTIYYTTDGSTPTTSSTLYTSPMEITSSLTLKYFAVDSAGNASPVSTEEYIIEPSPWPMRGHDPRHTGQSEYEEKAFGVLKWRYQTGGNIGSSPALGSDGTVYVGSYDDYLYAIEPDGTLKWRYWWTGEGFVSSPALGSDGTVYAGTIGLNDTYLYAIKSDGTLKWRYKTDQIVSSPAIGSDGTTYVGSVDTYLYAIKSDGTLKWRYQTGGRITSSPAIGSDGTVYVGSDDDYLYAIKPDGTLKWRYQTGNWVRSSPAIGSDGTVYVGSNDNYLYALNPDGSLKWRYQTGYWIVSSPAIGSDGTVYVGSFDHHIYAINPDGALKWRYQTGDYIYSSPAIGSDGTVYVGSYDHYLYAINPDGTFKWRYQTGDYIYSSPAIGSDGTVYVGSYDYYLYAFNIGQKGVVTGQVKDMGTNQGISATISTNIGATASATPGGYYYLLLDPGTYQLTFSLSGYQPVTFSNATVSQGERVNLDAQLSIAEDQMGPTGSISINGGAPITNNPVVTLALSAVDDSGIAQMQLSNDSSNWSEPEAYATTKAWRLSNGDGTKTVYVKFKDNAGNWSDAYSANIKLDTTAPTGSISINSEAAYANNASVTLTLSATDENGVSQMQLSGDNVNWQAAQPYTISKAWVLVSDDGPKTIYVKYQDTAGNWSQVYSDDIILDTTAPTCNIMINAGAVWTNNPVATLNLTCTDANGVSQMQFSNDNVNWSTAEAYASTKSWSLLSGDGLKTVYAKFIDNAGNWSVSYASTIGLDTIAPIVTATAPGGAYNSAQTVTLSANEPATIFYTTDGTEPTASSPVYSSPISITASATLKFFAEDRAGNRSAVQTENYILPWTVQLGSAGNDDASGVALDGSGNIYVSGNTDGNLDGNINAGGDDIFLIKFDSLGNKNWTKQLGTSGYDESKSIAVDNEGNIFIAGRTSGSFDGFVNAGQDDVFLMKLDASGSSI